MKYNFLFFFVFLFFIFSCGNNGKKTNKEGISPTLEDRIEEQYTTLSNNIEKYKKSSRLFPKTTENDTLVMVGSYNWTSGFYPGALWNIYGLTKEEKWKEKAIAYTEKLDTIQYWEGNHDVGFIIECSYGNALKYLQSDAYENVIVQTAKSLATRFKPNAGILQSWDWNKKWECPVIIDNMMNLELLFHATRISGDSTYYDIAVSHANTTMKNHFREDGSSYHVVDYNPKTGEINEKVTHQGLNDESAWARGQSWGLYGYTMCYRETGDEKYLEHAKKIAGFIMNHPNMPKDGVPYWDYDAPANNNTPRDASAAAIMASALYELEDYVDKNKSEEYLNWADKIMKSLGSEAYLAKIGANGGFLLKHSVGNKPGNIEINVPLNYADYYYLEALLRKKNNN